MESKPKKILVIVESIDVEDSSGTKGRVALIQNLHRAGFELHVLHYTRKNIALEGIKCISITENKSSLLYFLSRIERRFTRLTKINLNRKLEGFFGFSFTFFNDTNSIAKAIGTYQGFNPDWILTLSKGASFRPHYALLKLPQLQHKWMAYVHDPFPYHFYPRPYNWIQPGYRQKEQFFREVSERAAVSIFPSLLLQEWMGSYFPNFNKTGIIIPHQIDSYKVENVLLPDYFDPSKFTLLHAGNLMKQRSPAHLLEAFNLFLSKNPLARQNAQLLLLGPAVYFRELLDNYTNSMPELVAINQSVGFDTVYKLQQNVSVNIILESKAEISPFLPGKFPHCIAAEKPIVLLGPYYSETKRLLGDDYPYWAEVDNVLQIEKIITQLYSDWQRGFSLNPVPIPQMKRYLGPHYLKEKIEAL